MLNKAELGCLRLCENGQEALDALEAEDFDLVLMDINMPVMDGEQATRELRERGDTVPIIALTATPPDKRKRFIAAGMDGYLNKPVTVEALTREVNCVLTKTGSKPGFEETLVGETQDPQSKPKPCMDFDFEKFSMLFGHDGELCAEVAGEFMAQAVEEIERIGIAWKVMDYKQLENGFHKLAGSAFNVQAHRLGHLCRQGESLAASEAPSSKIATAMEDVVLAFTHLRETLQTKLSVSNMPGTRSNA
jgi:CheY-like chemotaxis protein